jgi:CheY-like chemotaxis protein/two-component sensor histidine kinase
VLQSEQWTNDACNEAGQVVARQANHMARLLDDLLDVARITRGHIALRKERLDLRETTRSAIEALGPFVAEHGTHLVVDIPDEELPVLGDAARLQQIQANLLSNASKYSSPGGTVHLTVAREGPHAVIRVSDNGRGIEADVLPKIFDLFVQGTQSLARSEGGLGIGLTLLRSLVELHDGQVTAHSDGRGRGSTFTVSLPLAAATAAMTPSPVRRRGPARRVVIVEDQADARRMLQMLLERDGVHVFTAANGQEGAELIERIGPDLALVDLGLPIMSGYDLARRIRQHPARTRTHLVALSGYGQDSDVQAALDAGFDEHLTKPPDPERLEQLMAGGDA